MLDWSVAAWDAAGEAPPSPAQVLAALRAAFGGDNPPKYIKLSPDQCPTLLMTKHLDLSGIPAGGELLSYLVASADRLLPWWTLESLHLAGCGLVLADWHAIMRHDSRPFRRRLRRLDLSHNPRMFEGATRASWTPGRSGSLLLRSAPMEYFSLVHTGGRPGGRGRLHACSSACLERRLATHMSKSF